MWLVQTSPWERQLSELPTLSSLQGKVDIDRRTSTNAFLQIKTQLLDVCTQLIDVALLKAPSGISGRNTSYSHSEGNRFESEMWNWYPDVFMIFLSQSRQRPVWNLKTDYRRFFSYFFFMHHSLVHCIFSYGLSTSEVT